MRTLIYTLIVLFGAATFASRGHSRQSYDQGFERGEIIVKKKKRKKRRYRNPALSLSLGYGEANGDSMVKDSPVISADAIFNVTRSVKIPLGYTTSSSEHRDDIGVKLKSETQTIDTGVAYYLNLGRHVSLPIGSRLGWAQRKLLYPSEYEEYNFVMVGYNITPFTGMRVNFTRNIGLEFQARLPLYMIEVRGVNDDDDEQEEEEEEDNTPDRMPAQYLGSFVVSF